MKHHFKNLAIWERSRALVKDVYGLTTQFPNDEKFGLVSQMRRAAVSVPSNIAEGCGRKGDKELIQFLYISIGSLCELETQLYLSRDLNLMPHEQMVSMTEETLEIRMMIASFIKQIS